MIFVIGKFTPAQRPKHGLQDSQYIASCDTVFNDKLVPAKSTGFP